MSDDNKHKGTELDQVEMKAEWSVDRFFLSFALIVGYAIAIAIIKVILFKGLTKISESFWLQTYWFLAGAIFALYITPIIRKWYSRDI